MKFYLIAIITFLVVSYSIAYVIGYFSTHPEVGTKLALSVMQGIGTAVGACIGGALILRVKSIRRFIRRLFTEEDD